MTIKCEACGRRYYDSVIRECPKKPGHYICMYCCGKCKRRTVEEPGFGCKAFDKAKEETKGAEKAT